MKKYLGPNKIIFIYILLFICILSSLPITIIFYKINSDNFVPDTQSVFSTYKGSSTAICDLNGDGKKDILSINSIKNKYVVSVQCDDSKHILNPSRPLNSLGSSDKSNSINHRLIDFNRDNIPEIILQSSEDNSPLQHIFIWSIDDFKDVFSSTNNTLGVIDSSNNKTPRLISFDIYKSNDAIKEYMYIGNSFNDISYEKSSIKGLFCIKSVIDAVENPYEPDTLPDILNEDIDYYSKSILWKLSKNIYAYKFKDSFFIDTKCDKNGTPVEYTWNLHFIRENKTNKEDLKNLNMTIYIRLQNNEYKINGISIE